MKRWIVIIQIMMILTTVIYVCITGYQTSKIQAHTEKMITDYLKGGGK